MVKNIVNALFLNVSHVQLTALKISRKKYYEDKVLSIERRTIIQCFGQYEPFAIKEWEIQSYSISLQNYSDVKLPDILPRPFSSFINSWIKCLFISYASKC